MRNYLLIWLLVSIVIPSIAEPTQAQKSTLQLEKQYTISGSWKHVVKKENLNNFTTSGSQVIADFSSREAAVEAAQKLNDALKGSDVYAWMYMASERPNEDGHGESSDTNSSSIKKPKLSIVDPGGSANSGADLRDAESLLKQLRGKTGEGMLGSKRASITVDDEDTVRFSGEARGSGKLQIINGELVIESKSNFSKVFADDDMIFGVATTKSDPNQRAKWWFRIKGLEPNSVASLASTERGKSSDGDSENPKRWNKPTVWIQFSASGHESKVNNVSVHFHVLVLYPDHSFVKYKSISSYLGTLSREAQSLEYYYGPDRLAASPYIGGTWRETDGHIEFTVETVNQNEKKKTTGYFAYKPSNFINELRKLAIEPGRLALTRGSKSEYDLIEFPFYEKHFGQSASEARGAEQLVGL